MASLFLVAQCMAGRSHEYDDQRVMSGRHEVEITEVALNKSLIDLALL